ncbi:MAG: hypothetical protein H0T58_08910, partial [Gemmatimonadales bacterium]|nr:hypothetical protein [Gemmatimonadales bacterium]
RFLKSSQRERFNRGPEFSGRDRLGNGGYNPLPGTERGYQGGGHAGA